MNDTSLTFKISYTISSDEYTKIKTLVGGNFALVPILNNVDIKTYYDVDDTSSQKSFYNLFTSWGASFDKNKWGSLTPEWTFPVVSAGTNSITYTTDYAQWLKSETDVTLGTTIQFAVYGATSTGYPTQKITTIDYSDVVSVSCTFTKES